MCKLYLMNCVICVGIGSDGVQPPINIVLFSKVRVLSVMVPKFC